MAKHTPEPWWHSKLEIGDVPMMNTKIAKVSGYSHEEAEANGKRIVECVNACAGIDDPAAEFDYLRGAVEQLKRERDAAAKMGIEITNQRNAFLALVRKVAELGYTHGDQDNDASKAMFELHTEATELLNKYDPTQP